MTASLLGASRDTVTEQAAKADALVDVAIEVGFGTLRFVPRVAEV
jgi:hypothetical protein